MGYASVYPVAHNSTYVKSTYLNSLFHPYFATDPAKSLTGTATNNSWKSSTNPSKFNIDLGSATEITRIYLENYHSSGGATLYGNKAFKIYGALDDANGAAAFANTTVGDYTDLTLVHSVEINPTEHTAVDGSDPQYFNLDSSSATYRYYIIEAYESFNPTYPNAAGGFRRIELQGDDGHGDGSLTLGSITIDAKGGGVGVLTLGAATIDAKGAGVGSLALGGITIAGAGAGVALLPLGEITISATGDRSTPLTLEGGIDMQFEGGFSIASHVPLTVEGTIDFGLSGGFYLDEIEIVTGATRLFEIDGGFTVIVNKKLTLGGTLFQVGGGFSIESALPIELSGKIGYELNAGFDIDAGQYNTIEGIIFEIGGGFSVQNHSDITLSGTLFNINGSFELDGGSSCAGVLSYTEDTTC